MKMKKIIAVIPVLLIALGLNACHKEGPAEQAGQTIDQQVDKIKDAVDPAGPAEKAGRKIDEATQNVKQAFSGNNSN